MRIRIHPPSNLCLPRRRLYYATRRDSSASASDDKACGGFPEGEILRLAPQTTTRVSGGFPEGEILRLAPQNDNKEAPLNDKKWLGGKSDGRTRQGPRWKSRRAGRDCRRGAWQCTWRGRRSGGGLWRSWRGPA